MEDTMSYLQIKMDQKSREIEEKRLLERKRAIILLINDFLLGEGYVESSTVFQREASIRKQSFLLADNIDMDIIFNGFTEYFRMKMGKKPKYFREVKKFTNSNSSRSTTVGNQKFLPNIGRKNSKRGSSSHKLSGKRKKSKRKIKKKETEEEKKPTEEKESGFGITVKKVTERKKSKSKKNAGTKKNPSDHFKEEEKPGEEELDRNFNLENKITLKPLPFFYGEYRTLAESIRRDIIVNNPEVRWDDIVGLEKSKKLVIEAVVMPIKYPNFFSGVLTPWKGVLLYGPPGTGKTMLAKAVATECKTTFFNISASTLVSKWRGEGEKIIRVLFELAKYYAPSTIFLDEVDSILCQRKENEHQASRRMKTELLIQMDGISKTNEHVFILAASNLPWDLDAAVLRRLEKRILVGLPNPKARETILEKLLSERGEDLDYKNLAEKTEDFSGADLVTVCKEALMRPIRKIMKKLELYDPQKTKEKQEEITMEMVNVVNRDVEIAISNTKPSGSKYSKKYVDFEKNFGSATDIEDEDKESV